MVSFECKYPGCNFVGDFEDVVPKSCPKCGNKRYCLSWDKKDKFLSPVRESYALGCNPNEIARFQKQWPWMKFTPDGKCITESYAERKRVLKARGFVDLQ